MSLSLRPVQAALVAACALFLGVLAAPQANAQAGNCNRTIHADVVALDQAFFWNRLGAMQPQGMIFALRRDVIDNNSGLPLTDSGATATPGQVSLRSDKRPRPLVLRMNVGDCLEINFQNLLNPTPVDAEQPATRAASLRVVGLDLVNSINDDGSSVGTNPDMGKAAMSAPGAGGSLVDPGQSTTYKFYGKAENTFTLYSAGATTGGEGDGGSLNAGLFGAVNVEPAGSTWYRSQVTAADINLALDIGNANEDPNNVGHTTQGHPILDYEAKYPSGHQYAGKPILEILNSSLEIVHSDLTAVIAGMAYGSYTSNPVYPRRDEAFREYTLIYHDEIGALQAFPIFEDEEFEATLDSVRDAFAINYGTGGIGAEIVANRLGIGPMWDCTGCKYEEFFLSSWVVGDPAMIVDNPANATLALGGPGGSNPAGRATEAFYPDDPSNVYHSYLQDHVKFRISHGGSKEHHIHHLHAHQWLASPDSADSAYLDSQAFGPGSAFTLEMVYNGSGNRNQTAGDSIFHCHFYPHFAMGMWALWRVHDVFEDGSRRLADGEIAQGTPIPGVVPLPGIPMAPMPGAQVDIVATDLNGDGVFDSGQAVVSAFPNQPLGNPGFPFFIPGQAGHRPPHPPLDTIDDGGLPRHYIVSAFEPDPVTGMPVNLNATVQVQTPLDFTKELRKMTAVEIPADGTDLEKVAMAHHAVRNHPSFLPDGSGGVSFISNGALPARGAPFADPCIDDEGNAIGLDANGAPLRNYKAANIQIDAVLNKSGWHFPQMRIITLWGDVADTFSGDRAPEPFFFRANSGECVEFQTTNLVPNVYELDDFQVRTPTDVLGQHIHLVKFDVLASDGSANGWSYEDATFSPDEVRERIHALNAFDPDPAVSGFQALDGGKPVLAAEPHPYFGSGPSVVDPFTGGMVGAFDGAQTTVQRWMVDEVLNNDGDDRTLRTVFTHDHYGPSTHQQAGLYAGLVVEPASSVWRDPQTGVIMGTRELDGGPTSWRADILTGQNDEDSYREFLLEFADFQLAYKAGSHPNLPTAAGPVFPEPWHGTARDALTDPGFLSPGFAINPPGKKEIGLPFLLERLPEPRSWSEAISAADPGTMSVNYRTEAIPLRVRDPLAVDPILAPNGAQAAGVAGDLSHVFRSDVVRADPDLNTPPTAWPYSGPGGPPPGSASVGALTGDPITPLLRAYETDKIQLRTLVGATEEGHNLSIHGIKWKHEPSWKDSGWSNSQMMGISEHFEYNSPTDVVKGGQNFADYLYKPGSSTDDLWTGVWGIFRVYDGAGGLQPDLLPLPNNPDGKAPKLKNKREWRGPCPKDAPKRAYKVFAVRASDVLPDGRLVYNSRTVNGGPLNDPTAILFVLKEDLNWIKEKGQIVGAELIGPVEPLILRANAGDCIEVSLVNFLDGPAQDLDGFSTLPMIVDYFNANQVAPSNDVGLHAQLVNSMVTKDDGTNVGFNPLQTAQPQPLNNKPDKTKIAKYTWYAGHKTVMPDGTRVATPIEFGAINLSSSDPIKHASKGAVGALIIEPEGSTWVTDPGTRAAATVTPPDDPSTLEIEEPFREFVVIFQSDVNLRYADGSPVELLADTEDSEDSGQKGINYRTEPMWFRMGFAPDSPLESTRTQNFADALANSKVGGDPETPVFTATVGQPVRFRVLKPGGNQRNHVFTVHGHGWQELPFRHDPSIAGEAEIGSTRLGNNPLSQYEGSRPGIGPSSHFNALINKAGGEFGVAGDYLWRDFASFHFDGGMWGIFRVLAGQGDGQ